jgi:hypothetical protein
MRYQHYIENNFLIDEPKTGKLVPFKFRPVQQRYYDELVRDYDIENRGITSPVREIILKARREGFSSLILAIFAADDVNQENATETLVISYRDDATETFRKRYRNYVLSSAVLNATDKNGNKAFTIEDIQNNPGLLDQAAKQVLSIDSSDIEIKHNKAHFYCGTASARVGGRGGVLQKLLFSEEAHYPDAEKMTAKEIVDGTLRQVDIASGFVFRETTANGYGNYYEQTWAAAVAGTSRFKPRFYGWREMYSEEEFQLISSEFTDKHILKQEYPETAEEAFIASGSGYFDNETILTYIKRTKDPIAIGDMRITCNHPSKCQILTNCSQLTWEFKESKDGRIKLWEKPVAYSSYVLGGDVAEGVEGDSSVATVKDNKSLKTVASFASNKTPPDEYALIVYALGMWYNSAYVGVEVNKDGLWVNDTLFKMGYPNLYFREQFDDITKSVSHRVGFRTGARERDPILANLKFYLNQYPDIWVDKDLLDECLVFVRNKSGRPEAMSSKHDDKIMAEAIAFEIRRNAPQSFTPPQEIPQTNEQMVLMRLAAIKAKKTENPISQDRFI